MSRWHVQGRRRQGIRKDWKKEFRGCWLIKKSPHAAHKWTSVCECACMRSIVRISSAPVPTSWLVVTQLHHCTHMDTMHGLITQSRTLLWLISYGTAESQAKRIHANQIWLALGCNPSQKRTAQSIDRTLHKLKMALSLILGNKIRPAHLGPLHCAKSCIPKSAHWDAPLLLPLFYHQTLLGLRQESQLLFNFQPSMNINCFVWARANVFTIED